MNCHPGPDNGKAVGKNYFFRSEMFLPLAYKGGTVRRFRPRGFPVIWDMIYRTSSGDDKDPLEFLLLSPTLPKGPVHSYIGLPRCPLLLFSSITRSQKVPPGSLRRFLLNDRIFQNASLRSNPQLQGWQGKNPLAMGRRLSIISGVHRVCKAIFAHFKLVDSTSLLQGCERVIKSPVGT